MGRHPGDTNSEEHNERISAAIKKRYQDDPEYQLMLSKKTRQRWLSEYRADIEAELDELEADQSRNRLLIGLRELDRILAESQENRVQKALLNLIRELRR